MEMKNLETGEICPAHMIGEDANGKALFAFVDGWSLIDGSGNDVDAFDSDGNYSLRDRCGHNASVDELKQGLTFAPLADFIERLRE